MAESNQEKITVSRLAKGLALLIQAVREINDSFRRQLLIRDSQIEATNAIMDRLDNLEARFENVLRDYKAHCRICARLNILCSPVTEASGPGEKECRENERKRSSRCRTLNGFAKNTH